MYCQNQNIVGQVAGLTVVGGRCDDFVDTFDFLGDFFCDLEDINTKDKFKHFYDNYILDVCVARDAAGEIVCASYVLPDGYKSLNFSSFCCFC